MKSQDGISNTGREGGFRKCLNVFIITSLSLAHCVGLTVPRDLALEAEEYSKLSQHLRKKFSRICKTQGDVAGWKGW